MKEATTNAPRRKYDESFKLHALQLVEQGQGVRAVAQALGISENLLHNWKKARCQQLTATAEEVTELRARLKQVEAERDILKKALSICSRPT